MADVQPLRTLRYEPRAVGSLEDVIAPPYDVIDAELRAELAARSPFNVVEIDLPEGDDPYMHARDTLDAWRQQGVLTREREPALWVLQQDYTAPDGSERTRRGFFGRVRVEDYGAGRIRAHERTHPGPKEDRLRLTRATRANLSPIFSLFPEAMIASLDHIEPPRDDDPEPDLEPRLDDLARVNDLAYGTGDAFARMMGEGPADPASVYIARVDGEPAASTVNWNYGGDCSIWWVATVPEARGRGFAGGLMRRALAAGRENGCEVTTLQATKLGQPIYEKLGYRGLGAIEMWERRKPGPGGA